MRLTFQKTFDHSGVCGPDMATLIPYTIEGEPVEDVISCEVRNSADGGFPRMTIVVDVREHLSDHAAAKINKKSP
jgi:hypothetical protein